VRSATGKPVELRADRHGGTPGRAHPREQTGAGDGGALERELPRERGGRELLLVGELGL